MSDLEIRIVRKQCRILTDLEQKLRGLTPEQTSWTMSRVLALAMSQAKEDLALEKQQRAEAMHWRGL